MKLLLEAPSPKKQSLWTKRTTYKLSSKQKQMYLNDHTELCQFSIQHLITKVKMKTWQHRKA